METGDFEIEMFNSYLRSAMRDNSETYSERVLADVGKDQQIKQTWCWMYLAAWLQWILVKQTRNTPNWNDLYSTPNQNEFQWHPFLWSDGSSVITNKFLLNPTDGALSRTKNIPLDWSINTCTYYSEALYHWSQQAGTEVGTGIL